MLDRFLKPRWQHPDAAERRRGVEALGDEEVEALVAVATADPLPALRRLALRRLVDLDLLAQRGAEDEDAATREQAVRRLRELLCGSAGDAPPLADRLARLEAATDAETVEAVAREGAESELRRAAVARVTRAPVLRDVVLGDADPELRLEVLERIDEEALLERIAEQSRTSDKRVHHRAREMLDARREARERPVRIRRRRELICTAAEGLGANEHWARDAGRHVEMEREWASLTAEGGGPDPELEPRFAAARERFAAGLASFESAAGSAVEVREALIREAEALAEAEAAPAAAAGPEEGAGRAPGRPRGERPPAGEAASEAVAKNDRVEAAEGSAGDPAAEETTADEAVAPASDAADAAALAPTPAGPGAAAGGGAGAAKADAGGAAGADPVDAAEAEPREGAQTGRGDAAAAAGASPSPPAAQGDAAAQREARPPDPLVRLRGRWNSAPAHPDAEAARALDDRFEAACGAVLAARAARRGASRLEGLRVECEALLSGKRRLNERGLKRVEQRLREVVGDGAPAAGEGALAGPGAKVERQVARLRDRLREQVVERHALLEGLPARLDALAAAVEQGQSAEAASLADGVDKDLQSLQAMDAPADRLKPLRRRLKALAPKVRTMRAWEQYGTDQARERLCEEMEALAAAELAPPEIASRVREARARWKALAPGNPGLSQKLWRRFNAAATKAYEPCQAWFAERAEVRKTNLAAREEMIAAVDALADAFEAEGFDEASADWKTLSRQRRDLERHWRESGPVDRKAARTQDKRFRAAVARLDKHLDGERQRCLRIRERLIAEVEALNGSGDVRDATERCKALQREWQVTVPGGRRQEQVLWERFRGACDVLFEQLKQQQGERRAQGRSAIEAREALCKQLEGLLAVDDEGLAAARREVERLRGEWRSAPRAPRREGEGLDRRFEDLRRRFSARLRESEQAAARAALEALRARAGLCDEAEARAAAGGAAEDEVLVLRGRWESLPPAGEGAQPVDARFERALAACADEQARAALLAQHGANREAREALCLRMEIVAGVDSPPQFAQARMQAQVARLASAFGGRGSAGKSDGDADGPDDGESLLRRWCAAGPAATDDAAALEIRFSTAYRALAGGG